MPNVLDTWGFKILVGLDIVIFFFTLVVAADFWNCHPATKTSFPALLLLNVAAAFIHGQVAAFWFDTPPEDTVQTMIRPAIYAAIWIPYFRMSKRVAETFVENPSSEEASLV